MVLHILQVCDCALELETIDGLCGFTGIFKGDTEVGAASSGGFARLDVGCCVADLYREILAAARYGR